MPTLYEHPLSPYAQKVKIALYEKGVEFEARIPNLLAPATETEFQASNVRLEVPSLVDGDVSVFDSTVILEYIEDKWPSPPLLPSTPAERARVRMIEEICDTYVEAILWAVYEIRVFERAKGDLAETLLARASSQIDGAQKWLARQLGERPFFNGDTFGWGDLSVWPYVAAHAAAGFAPTGRLAAWLEKTSSRESTSRCAQAALESMTGFQSLGPLVEGGMFKREYRDHRLEWMIRSGGRQIVLDGLEKGTIRFAVELA